MRFNPPFFLPVMSAALRHWIPWAAFALLWADLVRQLSYIWSTNEQYAYGWFVPVLACGLFWKRWITRPSSSSLVPGRAKELTVPVWSDRLVKVLLVSAALLLLPIRVIHEINQDWPRISWPLALIVVGFSLRAAFLAGGWAYVKHFGIPICLILAAVRWPNQLEAPVVQGSMRLVAGISAELLGWANIPCIERGNLIEISSGVVGVDEACSGIRSLQSSLVAALFLGELFLFRWSFRLLLLGCGIGLAFFLNCVRVVLLTWRTTASGAEGLEKWHDPAGVAIVVACFICLWVLGVWLQRRVETNNHQVPDVGPSSEGVGEGQSSSTSATSSLGSDSSPLGKTGLGLGVDKLHRYLLLTGCWYFCVITVTWLWYSNGQAEEGASNLWSVVLPEKNPSFQRIELSHEVIKRLGHDKQIVGKWSEPDGSEWTAYFLRWNPRPVQFVMFNRIHRPDVCLPASGFVPIYDGGVSTFDAGPVRLPFHRYTFRRDGELVHVFFCVWMLTDMPQKGNVAPSQMERLLWVATRQRRLAHQTLEVAVSGYHDMASAEQELQKRLPDLVRMERSGRSIDSDNHKPHRRVSESSRGLVAEFLRRTVQFNDTLSRRPS